VSWLDSDFLFGLIGALGVLVPLLGTPLVVLWRWSRGTTRQLSTFLEDWNGEGPRPGVPARLGVMERLAVVEGDTAQLRRNGGAHLADKIEAIAKDQVTKHERLDRIEEALSRMANTQAQMMTAQDQVVATLRVGEHRFERIDRALTRLDESRA